MGNLRSLRPDCRSYPGILSVHGPHEVERVHIAEIDCVCVDAFSCQLSKSAAGPETQFCRLQSRGCPVGGTNRYRACIRLSVEPYRFRRRIRSEIEPDTGALTPDRPSAGRWAKIRSMSAV